MNPHFLSEIHNREPANEGQIGLVLLWLICLVSGGLARAESIVVGDHDLLPNTPDQPIEIIATGDKMVAGLSLYTMVGDGGPEIEYYGFVPGAMVPKSVILTVFQVLSSKASL